MSGVSYCCSSTVCFDNETPDRPILSLLTLNYLSFYRPLFCCHILTDHLVSLLDLGSLHNDEEIGLITSIIRLATPSITENNKSLVCIGGRKIQNVFDVITANNSSALKQKKSITLAAK